MQENLTENETMTIRLISNSEVSSWLQCRRKWYFEYMLNLEPKQYSDPITRGILIHSMLENYYASKALGSSEDDCREAALGPLLVAIENDLMDLLVLSKTRTLINAYFDFYESQDKQFEIFGVESKLTMPLSDDFSLVGTVDLIWFDKDINKYWMVDHKSSYNFWSDDQVNISGQFIKYIALGKELGLDIAGAMVNQIRTRDLKNPAAKDLFKRSYTIPSEKRSADVIRQHANASEEIMNYMSAPDPNALIPLYNKWICADCSFLSLCEGMSEERNTDYDMRHNYQTRTGYGYN